MPSGIRKFYPIADAQSVEWANQAKRSTASEPATFGSAYGDWTDRF